MLGQNILHYQILERLGAGGMGEIFKAQDTRLNRVVAIKVLSNSTDPEQRRRFIQEAQAASSLNHPNIVVIHDILSVGDDQFMVMEFVNGKTLGELIPQSGLSVRMTLNYAVQAADGLHAAHSAGIIHRDLKPGNLMVNTHGTVKILDFGLAKVTYPTGSGVSLSDHTQSIGPAMTVQGSILGTLSYMSPEQAQGVKVDARTDIFSFGCVLYEMLTGRKAFAGDTNLAILTSVMRDDPPLVSDIVPTVPLDLAGVVRRALAKKPADRWQSMEEMHAALLALRVRSDSTMLTGAAQLPPPRRRPWIALAIIALMLAASGFGGMWWWNTRHAAPPAPHTDAPGTPTDKPSTMPPVPLTNQSILDMWHAKVPASVMVSQIRSSQTNFNLSTPEIIRLSKEGVPEEVLQAMRNPAGTAPGADTGSTGKTSGDDPATTEPAVQTRTVQVPGGVPFDMTLEADVPTDCEPGQSLRFRVSKDVSVDDAVVVAKGATVTGIIVEGAKRKMVVRTSRPTFRLLSVEAVDGTRLKVRATAGRLGDSRKDPPLEPLGGPKAKDVLAPAGSRFLAWFDGDQSITVRR
jgi:serine/threonine protein kinase